MKKILFLLLLPSIAQAQLKDFVLRNGVILKMRKFDSTTIWTAINAIQGNPAGGTTGQVLTKNTNTNYDYSWATPTGGGGSSVLTNSHIFVGNGSNVATDVAMSGDITIGNTGATAIGANKVLNTMISSVAWNKITSTPTTLSGYGITDALSTSTTSTQDGYFGTIKLKDVFSPSHYLTIQDNEDLTANHTLNLNLFNGDRILELDGNLQVTGLGATISGIHSGTSSGTNTGDQTNISGNAGTATALQNSRTIWGQSFDGTANVTGSLTAVQDITGGATNMNITSGTGASRTMTLKTTTSGSTATTALTLAADQSATFANTVNATTFVGALTGTASKATNLVGGNSTTLLGSLPYQSNTDVTTMLSPNVTSTNKFLTMTGTGTNGAAPIWNTIAVGDVPTLNQTTTGSAATLTTTRTLWGQNFNGSANVTGSLTSVADITGGASSMNIIAGTGNSRTMTLQSTTSGGVATAFLTGNADQSSTFGGNISGTGAWGLTGGAGNMTITSGTGNSRTMILKSTTSGGVATTFLTGNADQSATFANTVNATTFVGALTGNASTATTLQNARTINGTSFDGSANITVTAAAGTLTGSTLNSTVTTSSLTSHGTITSGGLGTGAVIGGTTMTLGSDGNYDIYYRNSSGVLTRLAAGADGNILTTHSTTSAPTWNAAGAGSGTVTNTGGNLTANALVLGAGGADTKVVAGITSDGTSQVTLGVNTTTLGKVKMFGNTSGDATIQPAAVAGTATVITLPATTSTLSTLGANTYTGTQTMAANSTSIAPIGFTTGGAALKTTSAAGDMEVNSGGILYYSTAGSERGILGSEQFIVLTSANTLTSQTGVQPIFDGGGGPTNGRLTVAASRSYWFELSMDITNMSTTTGTFSLSFGGTATLTNIRYQVLSRKGTLTTAGNAELLSYNVATASPQGSTGTAVQGTAYYTGIIRVNGAGTLIPQLSFTTVAGAVTPIVSSESFLRLRCIGTNTVVTVGNWD